MTEDKKNTENQKAPDNSKESAKTSEPADSSKDSVKASKPADSSKDSVKVSESVDNSKESAKVSESVDSSKDSVKASESADSSKASAKASEPADSSKDSAKASEPAKPETEVEKKEDKNTNQALKLQGLFAFKQSMTTFYNEKGESVPVTALKYEPCYVSQIKTQDKESYNAVQVAFKAQKNKRCSKALIGHLTPAGFKEGARFVREIRQDIPEGIKPGQELSIESLKKGDLVKISSLSKGRGFAGVMKKWNFGGGKASHGSKSHRRTGSIGQHTEPARVMPGRKMPGQYGNKKVSKLKIPVVEVFPEEGIIFVKGPVPGARNSLVSLVKM